MATKLSKKVGVTIPKQIRDALGLNSGSRVDFEVKPRAPDRFEAVRDKADVKWRTKELMSLLRK